MRTGRIYFVVTICAFAVQFTDHPEISTLGLPAAVQYLTMNDWTRNFEAHNLPTIRELYEANGFPDRVDCKYFDTPHSYDKPKRERTYWWMEKWVRGNQPSELVVEPDEATTFPPETLKNLAIEVPANRGFSEVGKIYRQERGCTIPDVATRDQWRRYRQQRRSADRSSLSVDVSPSRKATHFTPELSMMKNSLILSLMVLSAGWAQAENWPGFRGPSGQGLSSESNLPLHWGPTSNVVWKTAIPGSGWSSPVVWDDRIFVTSTTEDGVSCQVFCIDRPSGKMLWNCEVFRQVPQHKEQKNSHATPTPVTDGERVYAVFSSGGIAALNFDGSLAWTYRDVAFYSRHGLRASPIRYEHLLIMPFDGSNRVAEPGKWPNNSDEERLGWQIPWDKSFILALDVRTGKQVWTAKRGMSRVAHTTPNLLEVNGKLQLISTAGDVVQGFDPETGARIWSVYSAGEGLVPGFAMGDELIFSASGYTDHMLRAVRPGGKGDVTASHIAWEARKGAPSQSSLLYITPYLYAVSDGGIVTCYRGSDGTLVRQERIGGRHCASPVLADRQIYFLSEDGETVVMKAGPQLQIIARNTIEERCQASIAVSQGQLFIRSENHLYCIGN